VPDLVLPRAPANGPSPTRTKAARRAPVGDDWPPRPYEHLRCLLRGRDGATGPDDEVGVRCRLPKPCPHVDRSRCGREIELDRGSGLDRSILLPRRRGYEPQAACTELRHPNRDRRDQAGLVTPARSRLRASIGDSAAERTGTGCRRVHAGSARCRRPTITRQRRPRSTRCDLCTRRRGGPVADEGGRMVPRALALGAGQRRPAHVARRGPRLAAAVIASDRAVVVRAADALGRNDDELVGIDVCRRRSADGARLVPPSSASSTCSTFTKRS